MYIRMYIYIYIYIYMYMYNPHLGSINGSPPLFVVFLQTTFFTIH